MRCTTRAASRPRTTSLRATTPWRAGARSLRRHDYGLNSKLQSNSAASGAANVNFGSVAVPCTTGFYDTLFKGDAKPSDDCIYAVAAALQTRTENQQDVVEFNTQGGLFNLPAGEVRAAAGYQYRRNSAQFNPDILQSTASLERSGHRRLPDRLPRCPDEREGHLQPSS